MQQFAAYDSDFATKMSHILEIHQAVGFPELYGGQLDS